MAFTDGDARKDVEKPIQDAPARCREACAHALTERIGKTVLGAGCAPGGVLRKSGEAAERDGRTENLQVMTIDLILQAGIAALVETGELIEIVGGAVPSGIMSR